MMHVLLRTGCCVVLLLLLLLFMVRDDVSIDKKKREKIKFFHSYYSANIGNSVSLDSKDDMSPWPRSRPLRKFVQKKKKKKKK